MALKKQEKNTLRNLAIFTGSALIIGSLFGFTSGKVTVGNSEINEDIFSDYFDQSQVQKSEVARSNNINNVPNEQQLRNAQILAQMVLDPLARLSGRIPLIISWFRSVALNSHPAINGSSTSDHLQANAADIDNGGTNNVEFIRTILQNAIPFKQLIIYNDLSSPDWLHISYDPTKSENEQRNQILIKAN